MKGKKDVFLKITYIMIILKNAFTVRAKIDCIGAVRAAADPEVAAASSKLKYASMARDVLRDGHFLAGADHIPAHLTISSTCPKMLKLRFSVTRMWMQRRKERRSATSHPRPLRNLFARITPR